jgi:DNA-binding CsgD family transcriptional regulator
MEKRPRAPMDEDLGIADAELSADQHQREAQRSTESSIGHLRLPTAKGSLGSHRLQRSRALPVAEQAPPQGFLCLPSHANDSDLDMTKASMNGEHAWCDARLRGVDHASLGIDPDMFERNVTHVHLPAKSRSAIESIGKAYRLTPTEMRVLRAVVEVGGIRDIAAALSISPTTVKTHLRHIFQKIGVKGQVDLIRLVARTASGIER